MTASRTLPLLLALTLLFAQQAAQAHELSHLGPDTPKDGISHTTLCAKCSTFGQLSSIVPTGVVISFDPTASALLLTTVDFRSVRRTTTAFQSRAPPSFS